MSDLREAARRVALVAIQHIRRLDELGDAVLLSAQVELERAVAEEREACAAKAQMRFEAACQCYIDPEMHAQQQFWDGARREARVIAEAIRRARTPKESTDAE